MQRAINRDNIALRKHIFQLIHSPASYFFLHFWLQGLIIEIQKLFAVKGLQSPEDSLSNPAHCHCPNSLPLEVVFTLCDRRDVPITPGDLLMGRDEVADQHQNRHDHMLGHGDHVRSGDFSNSNAPVSLVGCIEIDVIRTDAGGDGELQVLGFGKALRCQVPGMEAA